MEVGRTWRKTLQSEGLSGKNCEKENRGLPDALSGSRN